MQTHQTLAIEESMDSQTQTSMRPYQSPQPSADEVYLPALIRPFENRYYLKDYRPVDSRGQEIRLPSHRHLIDMARDAFLHECETTPAVMGGLTRGKLEAAVYQVLDGERPSLSAEQFIPFCNYLFWETSIPGRGRSGSFKKGEFLEKTLQVEPGYLSAKGILRPLTGKSECPSCGSVDATFRTYAFAETAKGADFVLTCVDCGHVERGAPAKTDDQNPDLPSFLTCKCQACSSARLQLRAFARQIPPSFVADRSRSINRMLKVGLDPRFSSTDLALRGHYIGEMDDWTQRALGLPGKNAKSNADLVLSAYAKTGSLTDACQFVARETANEGAQGLQAVIVSLYSEFLLRFDRFYPDDRGSAVVTEKQLVDAWNEFAEKDGSKVRKLDAIFQDLQSEDTLVVARALEEMSHARDVTVQAPMGVVFKASEKLIEQLELHQPVIELEDSIPAEQPDTPLRRPASAAEVESLTSAYTDTSAQRWLDMLPRSSQMPQRVQPASAPLKKSAFVFAEIKLFNKMSGVAAELHIHVAEGEFGAQKSLRAMFDGSHMNRVEMNRSFTLDDSERTVLVDLFTKVPSLVLSWSTNLDIYSWQDIVPGLLAAQRAYSYVHATRSFRPINEGPTITPRFEWEMAPDGTQVLVPHPEYLGYRHIADHSLAAAPHWYVDMTRSTMGPLGDGWSVSLLKQLDSMPGVSITDAPAFARKWEQSPYGGLVPAPHVPKVWVESTPLHAVDLHLEPAYGAAEGWRVKFDYGPPSVHGTAGPRMRVEKGDVILVGKDLAAEKKIATAIRRRLKKAKGVADAKSTRGNRMEAETWLEFQKSLRAKPVTDVSFRMTASPSFQYKLITDKPAEVEIRIPDDSLTDVGMGVEVGGKFVKLDNILKSLAENPDFKAQIAREDITEAETWFVRLDAGYVDIPLARLKLIFQHIWELESGFGASNRRSPAYAISMADLAHVCNLRLVGTDDMKQRLRQLTQFDQSCLDKLPASIRDKLWDTQRFGVAWMYSRARANLGGLIADEMGLGKTLMALSYLYLEHHDQPSGKPTLVVAPKGVEESWRQQMAEHGVTLRCESLPGKSSPSVVIGIHKSAQVVFTTFKAMLLNAVALSKLDWHSIVVDEGHEIRNHTSQTTAALLGMRSANRFLLTGTPWNNSTMDLWPQYEFVVPGLLGEARWFKTNVRNPMDERGSPWHFDMLKKRIAPFTLIRTKKSAGMELQVQSHVERIEIEFGKEQADLHESVRIAMVKEVQDAIAERGFKRSGAKVLEAIMRLRQVTAHPALLNLPSAMNVPSAKMQECMKLLTRLEAQGHQTVVCSPLTSLLKIIADERLKDGLHVASITGETSSTNRVLAKEELDSGELPLLLLSMKAGGVALNLQSANCYIQYDSWWNPASEKQARARVARSGQKRDMYLYELVVKNSIDERLTKVKTRKAQIADAIFGDGLPAAAELTEEDVWELLAPIPGPAE